jgi:transcriptional regulator with GAF, ATPase, and Fis domain
MVLSGGDMLGDREQSAAQLMAALQSVLTQVAKPSQVLKTILSLAVSQTGADRGVFVDISQTGQLAYRVLYRFQREEFSGEAGRFSRSIFARVLETGQSLLLADALHDPSFMANQSIQDYRLVSTLCVPIKVKGEITALVHLESKRPGQFSQEHQALLESLMEVASAALATLQVGEHVLQERDSAREELEENREALNREWSFGRFVGRSPAVRELENMVRKAAATDYPILLIGETGTGKSILARVLHHSSSRAKKSFVTVFCPSLEKGMVEAELFGHKRGAFTGAVSDRQGKVQAAAKGTLFLDEIGELPPEIQPKLLRLLQERTYERVGDASELSADVRVIAATNRDLEEEISAGRFRRDLFERLNYVPIRVPPLRERKEDIPLLLRHCLDQNQSGRWVELSDEALDFLLSMDFAWPGNVRHIEQLAVRLGMEDSPGAVGPDDLRRMLGARRAEANVDGDDPLSLEAGLPALLASEEKKWIEEALRRHPNLTRAELAEKLKVSESALYKKLRSYDINN